MSCNINFFVSLNFSLLSRIFSSKNLFCCKWYFKDFLRISWIFFCDPCKLSVVTVVFWRYVTSCTYLFIVTITIFGYCFSERAFLSRHVFLMFCSIRKYYYYSFFAEYAICADYEYVTWIIYTFLFCNLYSA